MKNKNKKSFRLGIKELIISISALFAVVIIAWLSMSNIVNSNIMSEIPISENVVEKDRHPLTGETLVMALDSLPQVFGVMVENSADAWPLSGLDKSFLVIEAPVESGIPRFITFFSSETKVDKIGPVRSARPYYLDWNDALDAMYAHVGGAPIALDLIKNVYDTIDLNQFWNGQYFYRQNLTRYAPHNVYTTSELLNEAFSGMDLESPEYDVWLFADDNPVDKKDAISYFNIDFAEGSRYDVKWKYDLNKNNYLRYQNNNVMEMEDGENIEVNNIVVIATDIRVIDEEGRLDMVTIGSGDAMVTQNGDTFLAIWKKENREERMRFYRTDGEEVRFNAGVIWLEVVSNLSQVNIVK